MRRATLVTMLLGAATIVVVPAATRAQQPAVPIPELADADASRLAAVMRADLARRPAAQEYARDGMQQVDRAWKATFSDAATSDPRAFVRARTRHFVVPPEAHYDEACSIAFSRGSIAPHAVYTLGKPATEVEAMMTQKGDPAKLTGKDVWDLMAAQGASSAGKGFDAGMRFYKAHGFQLQGPVASTAVYYYGDGEGDPVGVTLYLTNVGAGNGWGDCARLGNVALLTLQIRDTGPTLDQRIESTASAAKLRGGDAAYAAALARTGWDEERYHDLLTAALDAWDMSTNPEMLELFDKLAPTEKDPVVRRNIATRKRNAAWYGRHSAELGSLMEEWKKE